MTSRLLHLQIPSPPTTLLLHIQCTHTQTIITAEIQGGKFGMQRTAFTKGEYAKIEEEIRRAWEEKEVECYIPPTTSNEREEEEQETDEETGTKQNKARKKNIRHKEKKEFKIYFGDTEVKMQTLSAEEEYLARTRIWNLFYNVLEQTTNGYTTVPKKQGEKEKEELQSELTKMEAKVESLQQENQRLVHTMDTQSKNLQSIAKYASPDKHDVRTTPKKRQTGTNLMNPRQKVKKGGSLFTNDDEED